MPRASRARQRPISFGDNWSLGATAPAFPFVAQAATSSMLPLRVAAGSKQNSGDRLRRPASWLVVRKQQLGRRGRRRFAAPPIGATRETTSADGAGGRGWGLLWRRQRHARPTSMRVRSRLPLRDSRHGRSASGRASLFRAFLCCAICSARMARHAVGPRRTDSLRTYVQATRIIGGVSVLVLFGAIAWDFANDGFWSRHALFTSVVASLIVSR